MEIYIGKNNEKLGPFALDEIKKGLEEGRFTAEDLAWYEGCDGWIPLTSIPDLQISLPDIPLPEQAAQAPAPPMAELASRGRRLMAVLVDGVVSILLAIPGVIVAIGPVFNGSEEPDPLGIVLIGLAMILLTIVQAVLISKRGQSIGKIALGIRIAHSVDGSNPGFLKGFLIRTFVPQIIYQVPFLGFLFLLVDSCFIFSEQRQCIHDLMAETVVLKV